MKAPPGPIRVVTYNVHSCRGVDGRRSEKRIAEVLAELEPDIIGLQELDLGRKRSGGVDQAGLIAGHLGFERYFHPARQIADEHYGDAILSRWPIRLRKAAGLPSEKAFWCRENRGAIWVEIDCPEQPMHVINTHLGLGRAERAEQSRALVGSEWAGAVPSGEPLVLLGDFNSLPNSSAYRTLSGMLWDAASAEGRAKTFPTLLPMVTLDHIFVNAQWQVHRVGVTRTPLARVASDHFPLLAEISLRCESQMD